MTVFMAFLIILGLSTNAHGQSVAKVERINHARVEKQIDQCTKAVIAAVDSETAPAAIESCYTESLRIAVLKCRAKRSCIIDELDIE